MGADMSRIIPMVTSALAYDMKVYVINAVGVISAEMYERLPSNEEQRRFLDEQRGGASIIGPWGQILASPMDKGEEILYADVDLTDLTAPKLVHDFGGRYSRFDLLRLELHPGGYSAVHAPGYSRVRQQRDLPDGAIPMDDQAEPHVQPRHTSALEYKPASKSSSDGNR